MNDDDSDLEPRGSAAALQDEPGLLDTLITALGELDTKAEDAGTIRLVKQYAAMIDTDPTLLPKLGNGFLHALEALGMTPRARAVLAKRGGSGVGRDRLAEQRSARRRAREHNA